MLRPAVRIQLVTVLRSRAKTAPRNSEASTTAQRILAFYVKTTSGTRAITQFRHHRTYGDCSWTSNSCRLSSPNSISSSTGSFLCLVGKAIKRMPAVSSKDYFIAANGVTPRISPKLSNGGPVRSLQAFITTGSWADQDILAEIRHYALSVLADEDAVWNCDETGFPKKGNKSVGVKRQYSGTLGRTDNCQVAVFANYSSAKGHTFMDRRLFLPEEWADDQDRRTEAGVPAGVIFRTKPELALEMVANAVSEHVPFRWVGGDSIYGNSPTFVQGVRELGKWYVVDISSEARCLDRGARGDRRLSRDQNRAADDHIRSRS